MPLERRTPSIPGALRQPNHPNKAFTPLVDTQISIDESRFGLIDFRRLVSGTNQYPRTRIVG